MEKSLDIVSIGECLLELSTNEYFENSKTFNVSFGGDALTSAVAAKHMGARVGLITSIGDDYFKNKLLSELRNEGLDLSNIRFCQEKNGIYLCGHNDRNEFVTYRRKVAGCCLALDESHNHEEYIKSTKAVYSTGIAQSLSIASSDLVKQTFEMARQNDVITAYDPNYTSSFMTTYDTKGYLEDIIDNIDVLFLSLKNDVESLYELSSAEKIINYFTDYGVKTIVVKSHEDGGYYVYSNGKTEFCSFYVQCNSAHTMCAGDVFNGGFLAAMVSGHTAFESAKMAAKQSGMFIEKQGTIKDIPYLDEILEA